MLSSSTARWAASRAFVVTCPGKRKRDVILNLAHEHVCRQTREAQLLGEEEEHRRGTGPVPARRLERERREDRPTLPHRWRRTWRVSDPPPALRW